MSAPMSDGWIVIAVIAFACLVMGAQIYAVVKFARRLMGVMRGYAEPGKLAELLEPDTRRALVENGVDPRQLDLQLTALRDSPQLREQVTRELSQAVGRLVREHASRGLGAIFRRHANPEGPAMPEAISATARGRIPAPLPDIPEGFDARESGSGRTWVLAIGAGVAVAALARWLGWA